MSRLDFQRAAQARIRNTVGTRINPDSVTTDGSALNIVIAGASAIGDELDARSAARQAANLSVTARDGDLDTLVVEETFGRITRKSAAAAQVALLASRPSPATGDGTIPAGTVIVVGALQFRLDADLNFPAGQTGARALTATCTKLGSSGNIDVASPSWQSTASLFDPAITLAASTAANGAYATGGANRESNSELRARRALYGSGLDRNVDVLAAGALSVAGVVFASAIEELDFLGRVTGRVTLYVGDVNGRANSALVARVRAALRGFRLAGQHIEIVGSVPSLQAIVLNFGVLDGYVQEDVQSSAKAAVIAAVNALPPGATLARASIAAAIKSVKGTVLLSGSPFGCTTPSADVVPVSAATIFRTSDALVSFG